jgi:hypothetical protein
MASRLWAAARRAAGGVGPRETGGASRAGTGPRETGGAWRAAWVGAKAGSPRCASPASPPSRAIVMATRGSRDGAPAPAPDGRAKASGWRCNRHPACVPGCGPADAAALAPHGAGSGGGGAHSLTKGVATAEAGPDRASSAALSCAAALLADMAERRALVIGDAGGGRAGFAWGWHGRGRLCGYAVVVRYRARVAACLAAGPRAPARAGCFVLYAACRAHRGRDHRHGSRSRLATWLSRSEPKAVRSARDASARAEPRGDACMVRGDPVTPPPRPRQPPTALAFTLAPPGT